VSQTLDYEAFAECRGQQFAVIQEEGMLALELNAVEPLPHVPGRAKPFSLFFSGPIVPTLGQMTYRMEHPRLGELLVFLVPVQRTAGAMHYEAIFN
jgi:hypothetical protein